MSIKVVDAKVVRVSTALYRALSSFAASSLKERYLWNVGVHLLDKVIFEKTGKWRLVISSMEALLEAPNSSCIKYNYNDGAVEIVDKMTGVITTKEPVEIIRTYLAPDRELPFSGPLSLEKILDKMELYYEAARNHIAECMELHEEAEAKVE
jgi:hypothetical protein